MARGVMARVLLLKVQRPLLPLLHGSRCSPPVVARRVCVALLLRWPCREYALVGIAMGTKTPRWCWEGPLFYPSGFEPRAVATGRALTRKGAKVYQST